MNSRKVNWGVMGCSSISRTDAIPAILEAENSQLYAIASSSKEKALKYSKIFRPEKVYNNYLEILRDPNIDAIYISLPNTMHHYWSVIAMRHGKHVLCEKPISLNTSEVKNMRSESIKNNVLLMEAFMYKFNPKTTKVKELIEAGVIGEVKNIYSNFSFIESTGNQIIFNKELGGGCVRDVGCYCISIMRYLAGEEPSSVYAQSLYLNDGGVDTNTSGILRFKNGITGIFLCGFNNFVTNKYEVMGTKGRIEVPCAFMTEEINRIHVYLEDGYKEVNIDSRNQYVLEFEHFSSCILHGVIPKITMDESYGNTKVIEAVLSSAKLNKEIYLI